MSWWQTVVPAISALAGVALGNGLTWRSARRNWQRDKKYEVFNAVASAARTFLWRGAEIDEDRTDLGIEEQRERVRQAMFQLREQLASASLLTDGASSRAARDLEGHYGNVLYPYFFSAGKAEEHAPAVVEARRLLVRFQDAARQDLLNT